MQEKTDDFELLRMACEQGLITDEEFDQIMTDHIGQDEGRSAKSPKRLALEKGILSEAAAEDLTVQAWIKDLPRRFDGYRVDQLLGRGGMAVVFRAEDESLGKRVALKVLLPQFACNDTYLARFHREARIAAKLSHPNTVQVFMAGEQDDLQFLVMEYVEGQTLSAYIREQGRIHEAEALEITRQLAGALSEAAELGIIHRDLKPGNILISKWGVPKLTDFGIAKEVSDIPDTHIQMSITLGVVGTPTYMSPEQARGARNLDFRSDIYSLGATLYHMMVGALPHVAETPQETMVRVASEAPRPPLAALPDLSEGAGAVLCRMMAKQPEDRYESFDELNADLLAARDGEPVSMDYDDAVRLLLPARPDGDEATTEESEAASPARIAVIAGAILLLGVMMLALLKGC